MTQSASETRKRTVDFAGNRAGSGNGEDKHDAAGEGAAAKHRPAAQTGAPSEGDAPEAAESVTSLDMVLVDGARGPLRRLLPPARTTLRFARSLAGRPDVVARRSGEFAKELGRVVAGRSEVAPHKKDKRFADPAWSGNPLLRRVMQAHIATAQTAAKLVEEADLDWQDDERIRFSLTNLVAALAPSNTPLNPLLWKAVIDTGGRNAVTGIRRMASDLLSPPRVPSMVEPDAFTVGEDLAVTPGAVVFRSDVLELIQYEPTTPRVRAVPLLMVPPTINKFYIADLAPGRSIVEYYVNSGQQVFMVSWRNPDERHAEWGMDAYGRAVLDAMDAVEQITGSRQVALQAFCSGGIITSMLLAHLAVRGQLDRVAAASFAVTVLDWDRAGTVSALMDPEAVREATERSRREGGLGGRPGGHGAVAAEGLPRRRLAGRGVRVAAAQRPGLELLGQQLPAGQAAGGLRHPLLERRHGPDERGSAPRLHRTGAEQRAHQAGRRHDARHAGGPLRRRRRHLRHRRDRRPPVPLAVLLPDDAAARRGEPVRPVDQRAHRLAGESADQPEVDLPGRGLDPGRPGGVAGAGGDDQGLVVAGLHGLARRALRGGDSGPGAPRGEPRGARRRTGDVCLRKVAGRHEVAGRPAVPRRGCGRSRSAAARCGSRSVGAPTRRPRRCCCSTASAP